MKIVYDSIIDDSSRQQIEVIANDCNILFDTARLLHCRKIDTPEKAKKFLFPSKKYFNNPFLLDDVNRACQRLRRAKELNQKVLIYGDYDVDGVCAVTILYKILTEFGIDARYTVPERSEGYGLNVDKINQLNAEQKIDLIITVDCGISDAETIEKLKSLGYEIIVTDHHEPPKTLPDCIRINPKIKGQRYPFTELCGAGVAYKLGYALTGETADKYLDLVALATVADSMDLIEENRHLVYEGLKLATENERFQFTCLLDNKPQEITSQTFAYNIGPKINAGGRMGDAKTSLEFLIAESPASIQKYAELLKAYNVNRQVECDSIYKQAKAKIIEQGKKDDNVILVYDKSWQTGFVGIVAAKLCEEFFRPVIVFAEHDGSLKGSARSVEGLNIFDAISSASDLLVAFGGHSQAAGVTVSEENFERLSNRLNSYVKGIGFVPENLKTIHVDFEITEKVSERFFKEIDMLEPFGTGNRKPCFSIQVEKVQALPLKLGSPHYNFIAPNGLEMLNFYGEEDVAKLSFPIDKTVVFEANISKFRNVTTLKGIVKKVVICKSEQDLKLYNFEKLLDKILINNEQNFTDSERLIINKLSVEREDFASYYKGLIGLKNSPIVDPVMASKLLNCDPYGVILAIKVFIELGIIYIQNGKLVVDEKIKNPLTNSTLYSRICLIKGQLC